jgi:hypothetical protein
VPARRSLSSRSLIQQVGHLLQVAQQGVALRVHVGGLGQQLGVQPGAGERAAQLVADGQQQRALGFEHLVDVLAHGVDGGGQLAQFVGPCGWRAPGIGWLKSPAPKRARLRRWRPAAQQAAHVQPGQQREHQQRRERVADQAGRRSKACSLMPNSMRWPSAVCGAGGAGQSLPLPPSLRRAPGFRRDFSRIQSGRPWSGCEAS